MLLRSFCLLVLALFYTAITLNAQTDETQYTHWDLTPELDRPWEIIWGPDDWIWFTERVGRVSAVNPENGEIRQLLDIRDHVAVTHESGMLGMAIHPDFENEPYVFISYSFLDENEIPFLTVGKFRYDAELDQLVDEVRIVPRSSIANIHAGSRLLIGPDNLLYITIGDRDDIGKPQDLDELQGKILRTDLDGNVPEDNPFPGKRVWSLGHRNPQGLCWGPNGQLYSTEHGTFNDDEFNIIVKGGNYGWPTVQGYCDNPIEEAFCEANDVVEPITAWTPSIAPSGTLYYNGDAFPEWQHSVFVSTLKNERIYRMHMTPDGNAGESEEQMFNERWGRLRDFAFSPEGRIFVATTNSERNIPKPDRILEILRIVEGENLLAVENEKNRLQADIAASDKTRITVKNTGDEAVRIFNIRLENNTRRGFFMAEQPRSIVIEPDEQIEFDVYFAPRLVQEYVATFIFDSNTENGEHQVTLIGTGESIRPFDDLYVANFGFVEEPKDSVFTFDIGAADFSDIESWFLTGTDEIVLESVEIEGQDDDRTLRLGLKYLNSDLSASHLGLLTVQSDSEEDPLNVVVAARQADAIWLQDDWVPVNTLQLGEFSQCRPFEFSADLLNISDRDIKPGRPAFDLEHGKEVEIIGNIITPDLVLPSLGRVTVDFKMASIGFGPQSAELVWPESTPNAGAVSSLTVAFEGLEVEAQHEDPVVFPDTYVDEGSEVVYTYINEILDTARISSVTIVGGDADQFNLVHWIGDKVPQAESMCAILAFNPTSEGQKLATLQIHIKDVFAPVEIQLIGNVVSDVNMGVPHSGWSLDVSPNPAHSEFSVNMTLDRPRSWQLSLIDLRGNEAVLRRGVGAEEHIRITDLERPAGVYILRLRSGDAVFDRSLIVE